MKKTNRFQVISRYARSVRCTTVDISFRAGVGHIGSALSIADILTVLYFDTMNVSRVNVSKDTRDRFILSKGHAAAALYAVLYHKRLIGKPQLTTFAADSGGLCEHPELGVPGIEMTTGSLGHGMAYGCGLAIGLRKRGIPARVYVLVSDGECGEGSVWESAMFASRMRLDNLTVVVDDNGWQCFGRTREITHLAPFAGKWQSFGWHVITTDGHNLAELRLAMRRARRVKGKPAVVIARTETGHGVSFLKNRLAAHYQVLSRTEYKQAIRELSKI